MKIFDPTNYVVCTSEIEAWLLDEIHKSIRPWGGKASYVEERADGSVNGMLYVQGHGDPFRLDSRFRPEDLVELRSRARGQLQDKPFREMISWYVEHPEP